MARLVTAVLLAVAAAWGHAAERIRVVVPTPEQTEVEDLLQRLATAISDEDYATYVECFADRARGKYCSIPPEQFVVADLEMTVTKWLVTKSSSESTTVVLSYTLACDGKRNTFVSTAECVPGKKGMLIAKEISTPANTASNGISRTGAVCPDGVCPIADAPKPVKNAEGPQTISLFNRADGTPDENAPMWLDPRVLFERFPDRYPVCRTCKPAAKDRAAGKGNK